MGGPMRPLENCAVSLQWLLEFAESVPKDYTTSDVAELIVKPATEVENLGSKGCRFVDLPQRIDPVHVGKVTFYVIHRWNANFRYMVQQIQESKLTQRLQRHGAASVNGNQPTETAVTRGMSPSMSTTYVWLDLFAVNQHEPCTDLTHIVNVIEHSDASWLSIDREHKVLSRAWCIFELWKTLQLKHEIRPLAGPADYAYLEQEWQHLDIAKAKATKVEDMQHILDTVDASMPREYVNYRVRSALLNLDGYERGLGIQDAFLYPPWRDPRRNPAADEEEAKMWEQIGQRMRDEAHAAAKAWEAPPRQESYPALTAEGTGLGRRGGWPAPESRPFQPALRPA